MSLTGTAEVTGSTPLRSTGDLLGNRALRALRETLEMAVCNHLEAQVRACVRTGAGGDVWDHL